ncbi:uncharacterized protein LOC110154369 isoform X2 [Boleophthalmus pectinirostris]|uniref:uncharacterized protein LOC110154369 isoform X2 n=1 Tax=Boleophthalmus pectinirostris TaxID=150288 RepID=UPI0024325CD7|nr:uncharacterized protein LOC110154369 isoform X2 [Boleophthalmus pectinirostris]
MNSAVQMHLLRALVTECLSTAAEEILRLVHSTLLPDGQPCTKWVVDSQQLDAAHGESEPVGPQSNVEDVKLCWELHVEDQLASSTDTP